MLGLSVLVLVVLFHAFVLSHLLTLLIVCHVLDPVLCFLLGVLNKGLYFCLTGLSYAYIHPTHTLHVISYFFNIVLQ